MCVVCRRPVEALPVRQDSMVIEPVRPEDDWVYNAVSDSFAHRLCLES